MLYNGLVNYGITSIPTTHNKMKTFVPILWVDELYLVVHIEDMGTKLFRVKLTWLARKVSIKMDPRW